jgi:hypothetical protein
VTTFYEVPLSGQPQSFQVTMVGVTYSMSITYRDALNGGWMLDIADVSGNPLVAGIPLVTGANLVAQYAYLGFTAELRVASDGVLDAVPTFDNLGTLSHLYFAGA